VWTLTDVERAVRTSWGADTCDPVDRQDWHPGNPARGRCGVTALLLNDLFGGQAVQRPPGPPKRCREEYDLLRDRVLARLTVPAADLSSP
jgi:hypothetical protein